jgi:hypothetical protein
MDGLVLIVLITMVVFSLVVTFFWASAIGAQAQNKGRSFNAFFWLSFIASPFVMQLIVLGISDETASPAPIAQENSPAKSSPEANLDRLSQIKRLLDDGAITESEFETLKKQILG